MRNLVLLAATFLIMATAAFSQKSAVSATASEVSQKDEQQIRQLEAEMLKGKKDSLKAPQVGAVEQFRKAIEESEQQRRKKP
jgi:hypothetical protein